MLIIRARGTTSLILKQLGLFIDENKILCCEGRVNNSNLLEAAKHPILLPSKHHFTNLQ